MHKVYLKPGKEDSLKRFHPWIFSGAIARFDGEPDEGEVVEVYTSKKEFIAEGHFQIGSIAVRVLSFHQEPIDHDFWKRKLEIAYDMRRSIGIATNPTHNTYLCRNARRPHDNCRSFIRSNGRQDREYLL